MAEHSKVPAVEAAELLKKGYTYLDVRTPQEFSEGHAAGAVNIPLMLRTAEGGMQPNPEFLGAVKASFPDTAAELVVGCKAGNRSARACGILQQENYLKLVDNAGGWDGWVAAGLPVEK